MALKDVKVSRLGDTATFTCECSKAKARATWLKDGQDIFPDNKYDISVQGNTYKLTVSDVDSRDSGDYAIVIKGHRSEASLSVEAKPEFTISDKYSDGLVLRRGGAAVIEVAFKASPQPKITWKFNGDPLMESRRLNIDKIYNYTGLSLARAERSDAGSYQLSLQNPHGSCSITVKVIVLGK